MKDTHCGELYTTERQLVVRLVMRSVCSYNLQAYSDLSLNEAGNVLGSISSCLVEIERQTTCRSNSTLCENQKQDIVKNILWFIFTKSQRRIILKLSRGYIPGIDAVMCTSVVFCDTVLCQLSDLFGVV